MSLWYEFCTQFWWQWQRNNGYLDNRWWCSHCDANGKQKNILFNLPLMWGRALTAAILHSTFISVLSAERLSDFTIAVGNEFDRNSFKPRRFTRCAHVTGAVGQAESRTVKCDVPVVGQYVTVYLNTWNYLTICELEVHGHPIGKNERKEFVRLNLRPVVCGSEELIST